MSSNLIAQYETADGTVEIHGTNGGFSVFVGERMVQKDLNARDFACYMAHCLQAAHYNAARARQLERELAEAKRDLANCITGAGKMMKRLSSSTREIEFDDAGRCNVHGAQHCPECKAAKSDAAILCDTCREEAERIGEESRKRDGDTE